MCIVDVPYVEKIKKFIYQETFHIFFKWHENSFGPQMFKKQIQYVTAITQKRIHDEWICMLIVKSRRKPTNLFLSTETVALKINLCIEVSKSMT